MWNKRMFVNTILCVTLVTILPLTSVLAQTSGSPGGEQLQSQISRVENGLPAINIDGRPPLELSLDEWMHALDIAGLGVAIIEDYQVVWAKGYGVKSASTGERVTKSTLFQAASISKAVTGLAVLHEVQEGVFDLDRDINAYLRSWQLPYDDDAAGQLVTLRQLLSHSAGLTPGGFPGYERGARLPTVTQILDGTSPATNAPARIVAKPGAGVAYSGLGYTIIQLALVDQLGRPFPEVLNDTVLLPLGLSSSTFSQALTEALSVRAASGHDVSGEVIDRDWNVYPEMAAAGMWTTPTDLAVIAIEVAKSKRGDANRILSVEMTTLMLQREKEHMGLGFVIGMEAGTRFSHSGGNAGFRCHMRMYADTGKGIVIMSNSDNGSHLFSPLMTSVAREYGWSSFEPKEVPRHVALGILEKAEGSSVAVDPVILAEYVGRYELAPGFVFDVSLAGGQLQIPLGDQPRLTVYPESDTKFFYKQVDAQITFTRDESGVVTALVLHQHGRDQTAPRVE